MILADTNILAEFMRERPHPTVLTWAQSLAPDDLRICAVTVQEIAYGMRRLPRGRRRQRLESAWASVLTEFERSILAYGHAEAEETAAILVERDRQGRPMSLADAQIAGIARAAGAVVATRNVKDFEGIDGLEILDPFV